VIVVDSSVWIDHFRDAHTPEVARLNELASGQELITGDLIMVEVLQGIPDDAEFELVKATLSSLVIVNVGGPAVAVAAANNFRKLRSRGITVRKTIDNLIATFCILHGHELLYSDRDFDPFVQHLHLRSAMNGHQPRRLRGP